MCIAQCDAMISLIDDLYYTRAWCCIEVMMIQTLQRSYNIHLWYEHVQDKETGDEFLRKGPLEKEMLIADAKLTLEGDRRSLTFLERQAKLLGTPRGGQITADKILPSTKGRL